MIAGMLNRGTVKDSKQNSKMSQENRRERTPVRSRTRTATPTIGSGDTKRDLTVSSFMLALVLVGVVVAAHTDHPVFWLLVGPILLPSCIPQGRFCDSV